MLWFDTRKACTSIKKKMPEFTLMQCFKSYFTFFEPLRRKVVRFFSIIHSVFAVKFDLDLKNTVLSLLGHHYSNYPKID